MAGWAANWETSEGKGKLLKPALNDLRGALNERKAGSLSKETPLSPPLITSNEIITSTWFSQFQSEMTSLIPRFVNHTVSESAWNNAPPPPQMWTEADILGGASRLPIPTDPLISAPWLYQQYQILNLLRWYWREYFEDSNRERRVGEGSNWTNAVADYNANTWNPYSSGDNCYTYAYIQPGLSPPYRIINSRAKFLATSWRRDITLYASADVYLIAYAPTVRPSDDFHSPDGYIEGNIYKVDTISENKIVHPEYGRYEYPSSTIEQSRQDEPPYPAVRVDWYCCLGSIGAVGGGYARGGLVLKFDGPNGFEYKDW